MTTSITEEQGDAEYPLVLDIHEDEGNMSFSLTCRLKINENRDSKSIEGIIEGGGMSSRDCLDDEDASDYQLCAERKSVREVTSYLREKFPEATVSGTIKGTNWYLYSSNPRIYSF